MRRDGVITCFQAAGGLSRVVTIRGVGAAPFTVPTRDVRTASLFLNWSIYTAVSVSGVQRSGSVTHTHARAHTHTHTQKGVQVRLRSSKYHQCQCPRGGTLGGCRVKRTGRLSGLCLTPACGSTVSSGKPKSDRIIPFPAVFQSSWSPQGEILGMLAMRMSHFSKTCKYAFWIEKV